MVRSKRLFANVCRNMCDLKWDSHHWLHQWYIQQVLQHSPLLPHSLAGGSVGGLLQDLC